MREGAAAAHAQGNVSLHQAAAHFYNLEENFGSDVRLLAHPSLHGRL